jgi:2-polyprenyl-3-methyl-5-hydroxy-6-metoxy-1,4-benzoquinol methylase
MPLPVNGEAVHVGAGLSSRGAGPVPAAPAEVTSEAARQGRRRLLARTLSRARWREYRELLEGARKHRYDLWSLEDWLLSRGAPRARVAILRHDVDQHPRSALPMLEIERELGVRSTWYFRWRTASPTVIDAVRDAGGQVAFHYETLTRLARERGLSPSDVDGALVAEARELLRREIAAFQNAFGPIRSVAPHGDTRIPGVSNQILLAGEDCHDYAIALDANDAIDGHPVGLWLTDRSLPDGRWKEGLDPTRVFAAGTTPVLLLTHPNNWCSGVSLWSDRMRAAVLPSPRPGAGRATRLGERTGTDAHPPLPLAPVVVRRSPTRGVVDFGPVALSLRREVLRFYYDAGKSLSDGAGLTTLATNSELAESRAATLEHALKQAGISDVRGLDIVDIGCGFGALALVFAARGARVLGVDANAERLAVSRRVAEMHGLDARFRQASMEEAELGDGEFDVAVMNNSLCYLIPTRDRHAALRLTARALRDGGVLVVRNPNRLHPIDQFTGVPMLGMLPPRAAQSMAAIVRKHRSRVRLLSQRAARHELRTSGFGDVHSVRRPGESRLRAQLAGYQHLIARVTARA